MVIIRGRLATYGALWFEDEIPASPDVDILLLSNRPSVADPRSSIPFPTLVNDLSLPEDQLFAALSRTTRYEIRRAGARDRIHYQLIAEPQHQLRAFAEFYDRFATARSITPVYRRKLIAACEAGRLRLSTVSFGGDIIVWHAYVMSRTRVMLLHSASQFRSTDAREARARIARANKWAHWQDMLRFKAAGFRSYDWGGIFSDESQPANLGVNRFKRQFGGRPEHNYDCRVAVTLRGHLAIAVTPLLDRLTRWRRRLKFSTGGRTNTVVFFFDGG
jgi:hypothetical protein